MPPPTSPEHHLQSPILLFDGVCNLCNTSVHWVLLRDHQAKFRFAALQSETGRFLLESRGVESGKLETVALVYNGSIYLRSDAVLETIWLLGGWWRVLYVFKVLPRPLRNGIYTLVASNRYRWFGRRDECLLPLPEWKERFL